MNRLPLAAALLLLTVPAPSHARPGSLTWFRAGEARMADGTRARAHALYVACSLSRRSLLGRSVVVSRGGRAVRCRVRDLGRFGAGDLDASPALFKRLGGRLSQGRVRITWRVCR